MKSSDNTDFFKIFVLSRMLASLTQFLREFRTIFKRSPRNFYDNFTQLLKEFHVSINSEENFFHLLKNFCSIFEKSLLYS